MRRLGLIALAGCGRLGFEDVAVANDASGDADGDASIDASIVPANCTVHTFDGAPPGFTQFGGGAVRFTGRLSERCAAQMEIRPDVRLLR